MTLYGYDNEPRGGETISNCDTSKLDRLSRESSDGREFALSPPEVGGDVPMSGERTRGGDAAEPADDTLSLPACDEPYALCDRLLDERA